MIANFDPSLAFTLSEEGGWSDDPDDPGGATNKGITLATFRDYMPGATAAELRDIPDNQVSHIYMMGYWRPVAGDHLPAGLDLMVFDFGVNAGPSRSARMLQQAVGVEEDGIIGPVTLKAISSVSDTLSRLSGLQRAHYRALPEFGLYGAGWMARTDRRLAAALRMARAATE